MHRRLFALLVLILSGVVATPGDAPRATAQPAKNQVEPKAVDEKDDLSRVLPVYDPGSHTRPIAALGFTKDKSKLITVGLDLTIQVWSTSGERLDILRLPGYGREKGDDARAWQHAVISTDGSLVAIGGEPKRLGQEGNDAPTRLIVVDVPARLVRRIVLRTTMPVVALAFAPDGKRLAIGLGDRQPEVLVLDEVAQTIRETRPAATRPQRTLPLGLKRPPEFMAFDATGERLLVSEVGSRLLVCDVPRKANDTAKVAADFTAHANTRAVAWSPDGKQLARSYKSSKMDQGLELLDAAGKSLKKWPSSHFDSQWAIHSFQYVAADRIHLCMQGTLARREQGVMAHALDPQTGRTKRLYGFETANLFNPIGAASADGELGAATIMLGMETAIYRLSDGKFVARCGNRTPIPCFVGWANDPKAPSVAWSEEVANRRIDATPTRLDCAFDLARLEPLAKIKTADYAFHRRSVGEWSVVLATKGGNNVFDSLEWKQNGKPAAKSNVAGNAMTLIPNGKEKPHLVHNRNFNGTSHTYLVRQGEATVEWLPNFPHSLDMVSSPDGRYVLASTGTHRLVIYRTDGSKYPLFNLIHANGEWAIWTAEGYYAASPGGEKLIGWAINNGPNELVTFHPAGKFAKHFRRPDIIKLAFELGSVEMALKQLKIKPAEIEPILPPAATLQLLEQKGGTVRVKASAISGAKDKPVVAMRLLLDGRPLANGAAALTVEPGKPAQAEWEVVVPGGTHELKLLARSDDGATVSEPLVIRAPKSADQQPTLYRLCVGVNDYDDTGLKLGAAVKDATDVYTALEQDCVGSYNRFSAAKGHLIVNKDATRDNVLKALATIRKTAKPGDLVVVFFAGHGVKQDNEYYLLTKEADTNKSLKNNSLSGEDLRKALSEVECPVLLILDACHSAKGVKSFRPATDDLTRNLTDESAGVTVLAAAMAHEVASADAENGYFTAALLKALKAGEGVPFDPYERALYTHHVYSVVFSEVRKASNGKQNPFLNMPWTVPPLVLRDVPKP